MYKNLKSLSFFITVICPYFVFSQGGDVKQLSPFKEVDLVKKGKVIITQGDAHTIMIVPASHADEVKATVTGSTLSIEASSGDSIYITMKEITKLSVSGWGSIMSESPIKSDNLDLNIYGNGKMELSQLDVKKLSADIAGLGKVTVSGKAETTNISIAGSGKVDAEELKTATANVNIPGAGKTTIDVTDNLNVNISGSGKVNYVNPPKNISKTITGVGKVRSTDTDSDTTSMRFGNTKIVISDNNDNGDDDGDNDNDEAKDWENKWEKWGEEWGKHWEESWKHQWGDNFPFHEKEKNKKKQRNRNKPSWPGIEIGVNGYFDADNSTSLPPGLDYLDLDYGKSISFSVNIFSAQKSFFERHLFLHTGLGFTWNDYRFSNDITLQPNSSTVVATVDSINYTKNKLAVTYITAPLMAEYFFGNNRYKSFHVAAGMLLGYKTGSHTKQKYESDIGTVKTKVYDSFNLNPFRASVRVSLGYGRVNVFAERALTTFFEKDKGPILYPFTAGIGVSYF